MRTLGIIGRKGGSGKTTIACHLAIGFHLRGRKTILADTDRQRSCIEVFRARQNPGPEALETSGPKLFTLKTAAASAGVDAFVIDTPAVLEEEVAQAVALSDLCLLVVRPTFLDLASAIRTSAIIKQLRKPGLVVLNQAPTARETIEPPIVRRSIEALNLLKLPVAPIIIRGRTVYQTALESGRSAEELGADLVAAQEIASLCAYVDRFLFGQTQAPAGEVS